MFRLMQPSDLAAMKELWTVQHGDTAEFAEKAILRFAGEQNAYIAQVNNSLQALLLAVPVTLEGRHGSYLYGLCGTDMDIQAELLEYVCAKQKERGAVFSVVIPGTQPSFYSAHGFEWAFALRCLARKVRRNLWSRAEFDAVTAKGLCELRAKYEPKLMNLDPDRMAVVLADLYSRGATIVSSRKGYGVYFRKEETLYFVELMADDDASADELMEAAREKESIVEQAVITVGAAQQLYWGDGSRQEYGMIRFEGERFDVSESYMRLMLEG